MRYYNGNRWYFTWENGRRLETASDGIDTYRYEYNADGMRTQKSIPGGGSRYYYLGTTLMSEISNYGILEYFYDADGTPFSLKVNDTTYYYITNLQGDVVELVDENGNSVASYSYDPYGRLTFAEGELAEINPLRYRGYYYDAETGLYYVGSRYYDPKVGRWLNADGQVSTGTDILGTNLFAYCGNNPASYWDPTGYARVKVLTMDALDNGVGSPIGIVVVTAIVVYGALLDMAQADTLKELSLERAQSQDYKEAAAYAKAVALPGVDKYDDRQPRVHHIVPHGEFTSRSPEVLVNFHKVQYAMNSYGLMESSHNLVILSHGTHKSMHTDAYLMWVSAKLNPVLENKGAMIGVLHEMRIELMLKDAFSLGW